MAIDATSPALKRHAVHHLVNRNAQWQPRVHLKPVTRSVDECVFKGNPKMQPARSRFTEHALAYRCRPRRFDADDANVKETTPAREINEPLPHDADGRLDDLSGTSCVGCRRDRKRFSLVAGNVLVIRANKCATLAPKEACLKQAPDTLSG
jgi:hypothetical protein